MKRVMTTVLAVLLLAVVSIGGVLPVYATTADAHVVGVGADLPVSIGPDFTGYKKSELPVLNAEKIYTGADFQNMEPGKSYVLMDNIEVHSTYGASLGQGTFTGNFYGNGYTITTSVPLFKKIDRAHVYDLTIRGDIEQYGIMGALAAEALAPELVRVINYANVTTTSNNVAGGLIGNLIKSNFPTVFEYCENHGNVIGTTETGGLVGYLQGTYGEGGATGATLTAKHCLNTGDILSRAKEAGGLFGQPGGGGGASDNSWFYQIEIINCANEGDITANGEIYEKKYEGHAGGFFGESHAGSVLIDSCYNTGAIKARASGFDAGGIAARFIPRGVDPSAIVRNCYNSGNVSSTSDVAGIVGQVALYTATDTGAIFVVENCQNDGTMTGDRTGGILGCANENGGVSFKKVYIKDCTNNGYINSTSNYGGGIAARADVRTVDSEVEGFYDESVVFESCVNNGNIIVYDDQVGGMVGYSAIETVDGVHGEYNMGFYNCVNNGDITTVNKAVGKEKETKLGGMAGHISCGAHFRGCVNNGNLAPDVKDSTYTGGMAGWVDRRVVAEYCISAGDINGGRYIGGIVGATRSSAITDAGDSETTDDDVTVDYDDHIFVGNVVTANITEMEYRAAKHDKTIGGLAGYLWGDATATNNAVLANIKGTYNDPLETGFTVSAIFGKQGGDAACTAYYNYFTGTLDAGTYGIKVYLTNAPESTKLTLTGPVDADTIYGNFASTGFPLYYVGGVPYGELPDVISGDVSSQVFLNTLNATAGEGAFVQVTSCEGNVLTLSKDAMATYDLTRTHSDTSCDYYTDEGCDETHHWKACAVCGAPDPATVKEHAAADGEKATCKSKLTCATCGTSFGDIDPTNHVDTDIEWTITPTTHIASTDCCGVIDAEAHQFENGVCKKCKNANGDPYTCPHAATCEQGAVCEYCGQTYNGTVAHVWDTDKWVPGATDDDKHYNPCANCDAYNEASGEACSESEFPADCKNLQECVDCGQKFGDYGTNHQSDEFDYIIDANDLNKCQKVHLCCGAPVGDPVDHVEKTPATCSTRATCENCGWSYGGYNADNHESESVTYKVNETDPEKHDKKYDCCGKTITEAHTGGQATCSEPAKCEICKGSYGAVNNTHAFDHKCDTQCDDCGLLRSTEGHAFGGWLVMEDATETTSGYQMRACVVCGAVQTATIAPISNPDTALATMTEQVEQSDAYIGVIVIAAAGVVVFSAIVGFVVHKKKKAK